MGYNVKNTNGLFISLLFAFSANTYAANSSFEIHRTKLVRSIKKCPHEAKEIAQEILNLELAGMRWRKAKPSCFESLKMKYVHAVKTPDAHALKMVKVKKDSLTIVEIKENKEFYSQDVFFTVVNDKGETVKDSLSFMTNVNWGAKKPETGCALISSSPKSAFVFEDCL